MDQSATVKPQRWAIFSAAPHRMMFFAGALQASLTLLFWAGELLGRYTALWSPLPTLIPATWVHAFLMLYGLFPFFIFGFLMTTYPRWMNGPELTRERYAPVFIAMSAGMLVFYAGIFTAIPVVALGVALLLAGWGWGIRVLLSVYMTTPPGDKRHETVLTVALAGGWLGALAFLIWLLGGAALLLDFARKAGLWLFLLPVFFTVCHRMIPFFGSCVLSDYRVVKPNWSLPLLMAGVLGHLTLDLAGAGAWLFLFDAPLAAMAIHHSLHWDFRRALDIRLLAVLHIAFAWMGIGLTLYALQSLTLLLSGSLILGRAPLHALGIGFFSAMVVAMVTRVTLGHSGRGLFADRYTWVCFLGINAVALIRMGAELPALGSIAGLNLNVVAALAWLGFMGAWALRYAPMYVRPRADGKPG